MNRQHPAWRSPLHTIRDAISFATDAGRIAKAAFQVIDALQHFHPSLQLDALFVTAVAMSRALGLDPHELVNRALRILPDADGPMGRGGHIGAIQDYAKGELRQ